ncbi:thiol reductase thioredoxin [Paenibacillus psychroresistens]|uniref:Thioredoxin n=1 Tax=Paenibacillus psychroresistens TaxID=1778678 RepID=A0A6B8RLG6_9BACL|nr:thioredoxin domain-containing protein [Paenibacillus psychroresistens]QGQ96365.1 thiol reductase thioredoxin [Paenibacillus psychroresistens]
MITANKETKLKDSLRQAGVTVVEFGANWCPPCKVLLPILDGMDHEYGGSVTFVKVDCDESPDFAAEFSIMSLPTVVIFHNGEPVDKLVGLRSKEAYQTIIARYI